MSRRHIRVAVAAALLIPAVGACRGESETQLPTNAEIRNLYGPAADVLLKGNVVDVQVVQEDSQLQRGGAVWAKVGPYIYLFSPPTQKLFDLFPGLAGVRVRTVDESGTWVADALLRSGTLNSVTWKNAMLKSAKARSEGTKRPSYIIALTRYGEEQTEFKYNTKYVRGQ
jgi:hypothetical protein